MMTLHRSIRPSDRTKNIFPPTRRRCPLSKLATPTLSLSPFDRSEVARWQNLIPSSPPSTLAQSKERKGSNFTAQRSGAIVLQAQRAKNIQSRILALAIWQPLIEVKIKWFFQRSNVRFQCGVRLNGALHCGWNKWRRSNFQCRDNFSMWKTETGQCFH